MASLTAKTEKYQPLINEKVVNSAAGAPRKLFLHSSLHSLEQYDRYRVPPNFQHAEEHLVEIRFYIVLTLLDGHKSCQATRKA